jgi:hypothetical protein
MGAQSRDRRSNPDQSEQESRIPASQGFEDGDLMQTLARLMLPRQYMLAGLL